MRQGAERYEIEQKLRSTLYGEIHVARDSQTGQLVAIKMSKLIEDVGIGEDPVGEVATLEKLLHSDIQQKEGREYILNLYEHYETEYKGAKYLCCVMEFAEQGDLLERILSLAQRKRQMSFSKTRNCLIQVAQGLAYIHRCGFSHLDLSLENILLSEGQVRICDFGQSRQQRFFAASHRRGKTKYMAPEVYNCQEFDGARADVWSLGVMFWAMLTGGLLYEKPELADVRFKYLMYGIKGIRVLLKMYKVLDVPAAAIDLLSRMICVNVEKRYTAEKVLSHPWISRSLHPKESTGPISPPPGLSKSGSSTQSSSSSEASSTGSTIGSISPPPGLTKHSSGGAPPGLTSSETVGQILPSSSVGSESHTSVNLEKTGSLGGISIKPSSDITDLTPSTLSDTHSTPASLEKTEIVDDSKEKSQPSSTSHPPETTEKTGSSPSASTTTIGQSETPSKVLTFETGTKSESQVITRSTQPGSSYTSSVIVGPSRSTSQPHLSSPTTSTGDSIEKKIFSSTGLTTPPISPTHYPQPSLEQKIPFSLSPKSSDTKTPMKKLQARKNLMIVLPTTVNTNFDPSTPSKHKAGDQSPTPSTPRTPLTPLSPIRLISKPFMHEKKISTLQTVDSSDDEASDYDSDSEKPRKKVAERRYIGGKVTSSIA